MISPIPVIGGGPAGSATAIALTIRKVSCRLYEKKSFPRQKLCGGFVSPEALEDLKRLGVLQKVQETAWEIRRATLSSGADIVAEAKLTSPGLSLPRDRFDTILLQEARRIGIEVIENCDGWRAADLSHWVVVATGRKPHLDSLDVPGKRFYGFQAVFESVDALSDEVAIDLVPGAYVGWVRHDSQRVNLCGMVSHQILKRYGHSLDDLIDHLATQNNLLARRLRHASRVSPWLTVGPVQMGRKALFQGRHLFVGDAACVVDPFVGEGITMALRSAQLVARAISRSPSNPAATYSESWNAAFANRLPLGKLLRNVVNHSMAQNIFVSGLRLFPRTFDWIIAHTRSAAVVSL